MKKLLTDLKNYKKETVLAPLFKMLEASFELMVPLVVQRIVDVGIANNDRAYVMRMCLVMISLGVIGLVCSITAQYYSAKAAVGFATGLRRRLFTHMQTFSYAQMDQLGTSTMITRMTSDINQVQHGVNMVLRLFLRSPFIVLGAMVMAFTIDVQSALVFVVVIPLLSLVVFGIMAITIPLYKRALGGLDRLLGVTRGNLTGVRVLRAFHKEEEEIQEFDQTNRQLTAMQMFVGRISAVMNPVTYVIVNGGLIALLWLGGTKVDGGILTQGAVMALINYMSQILVELIKFANLIITVNKAVACGNRIESLLEIESDIKMDIKLAKKMERIQGQETTVDQTTPPLSQDSYAVEFARVSLTYPGAGADSLTDIDLKVRPGETVGIIGGTGSGKTSLINLIPRFYEATAGQVRVHGVPVQEYEPGALRARIGVVPQKAVLFKGTIRQNLCMGKADATEAELQRALEISQAADFVAAKPDGLDTMVSQGGRNLSGGQKQRLTIARALVRQPEILILDDSASALDYATDAALRRAIRQMASGTTVFLVSQRASSLMHADRILVLEDGETAGVGTHEELLATCEVYQEIYYSQYPDQRPKKQEGSL